MLVCPRKALGGVLYKRGIRQSVVVISVLIFELEAHDPYRVAHGSYVMKFDGKWLFNACVGSHVAFKCEKLCSNRNSSSL
jgi:hypothetical protein